MLDSVNFVQFKKAFRGNLSDMLVVTEACVEKNTGPLIKMFKLEMRHIHVPKSFSFCKGQKGKKSRSFVEGVSFN